MISGEFGAGYVQQRFDDPTIGTIEGGAYGLAVELDVHIPGVDEDTADKIVHAAHEVCPYSNATRGNIEVTLKIV